MLLVHPFYALSYRFGVIQHGASGSDGDHWRTKKPSPLAKDVARPIRRRQWRRSIYNNGTTAFVTTVRVRVVVITCSFV